MDPAVDEGWRARLSESKGPLGALLRQSGEQQRRAGFADTLREILHQPETWAATAEAMIAARARLGPFLAAAGVGRGAGSLVLTGSGSSLYAGECVAPGLQAALGIPVQAVAAGDFLTRIESALPPAGPVLVVHLARSGDSPESRAVLETLLAREPRCRHLVITCNRDGALARLRPDDARILRVVLDERTNDRSLVMTSSFTNMAIAARLLAAPDDADGYRARAAAAAAVARRVVADHAEALAALVQTPPRTVICLGSAGHFGAAREAGLKMLEMSAGQILAFPETFLGLRHGPMSAVHDGTLVLGFLSCDPVARAYEADLLREIAAKRPTARLVVVGESVAPALANGAGRAVSSEGLDALGDDDRVVIDVMVGQLLALFACLRLGLRPDAPSPDGMIARVVASFTLHGAG